MICEDRYRPNAEQIDFSVGYGACRRTAHLVTKSPKRGADETSIVGEGCSPLGRRHEVTVGDSPVRGNVRKADKRVAVLAERKASPPRNAPPETYVKMTLICGANACFRREDYWSSENDERFIDRKCRIGYKRSCHAVRRQAPYPTKRTSPLQPLYCDRRPAAGAPRRSPTNSL